jgi:hypothetical protein
MDDFDFDDWWSGSSYVDSGIPIDIPSVDISDILGSFDLSGFGGGFDVSDMGIDSLLNSVDFGQEFSFGDLSSITGGVEGFGDVSDIVGQGSNLGIDPYTIDQLTSRDEATFGQGLQEPFEIDQQTSRDQFNFGQGLQDPYSVDQKTSRDEFTFGQGLQDPYAVDQQTSRDQFTFGQGLQDPYEVDQQTSRNEFTFGQGLQDPYEVDQQTTRDEFTFGQGLQDPYEVDGLQGSRTEGTALTGTTPGGKEVIKTDTKKDETKKDDTKKDDTKKDDTKKDDTKSLTDIFKGKDNALLMALLGGLLGLLGRKGAPQLPVGYQGGIPKYTAARVPGRGVQYTRAAGGGLMDLAEGGTARYLRGGTDGMADKIKTSIDGKQPARLSHGEFVIPADVVSHLGNGNSDAGADVLYEMMSKVRKARTGNPKQGKQINPRQYTPA